MRLRSRLLILAPLTLVVLLFSADAVRTRNYLWFASATMQLVGMFANIFVVHVNGGRMPVDSNNCPVNKVHCRLTEATRFKPLCDLFDIRLTKKYVAWLSVGGHLHHLGVGGDLAKFC